MQCTHKRWGGAGLFLHDCSHHHDFFDFPKDPGWVDVFSFFLYPEMIRGSREKLSLKTKKGAHRWYTKHLVCGTKTNNI